MNTRGTNASARPGFIDTPAGQKDPRFRHLRSTRSFVVSKKSSITQRSRKQLETPENRRSRSATKQSAISPNNSIITKKSGRMRMRDLISEHWTRSLYLIHAGQVGGWDPISDVVLVNIWNKDLGNRFELSEQALAGSKAAKAFSIMFNSNDFSQVDNERISWIQAFAAEADKAVEHEFSRLKFCSSSEQADHAKYLLDDSAHLWYSVERNGMNASAQKKTGLFLHHLVARTLASHLTSIKAVLVNEKCGAALLMSCQAVRHALRLRLDGAKTSTAFAKPSDENDHKLKIRISMLSEDHWRAIHQRVAACLIGEELNDPEFPIMGGYSC
ncbi:hypothetical protein C8J56DRAFT_893351 [Mycena floridula]|nr:hypothetical protein C8J56DRAFT_893351 [Mycena floridula]